MYIDSNNFIKEIPYKKYYTTDSGKTQELVISTKYYLVFKGEKLESYEDSTTIRVFNLLSTDNTSCLKNCINVLFEDYVNINRVYTKLDLYQSFKQVRINKYFKVFNGKKQILKDVPSSLECLFE